jgi:hypothetical protein
MKRRFVKILWRSGRVKYKASNVREIFDLYNSDSEVFWEVMLSSPVEMCLYLMY